MLALKELAIVTILITEQCVLTIDVVTLDQHHGPPICIGTQFYFELAGRKISTVPKIKGAEYAVTSRPCHIIFKTLWKRAISNSIAPYELVN